MPNLFHGFESDVALQATLLLIGCATFFGALLCSRCPRCGWLEWVSETRQEGDGDDD
ncbi:hypothetical protein [uncultured Massilia sp.]|uniref:hypothetical protein n=1 Tax=uncultured Massilia sp. TaxID=169973 RepID=UPI0025E86EDE|nr:hypothetical protein [uncultured Massilia sp.]